MNKDLRIQTEVMAELKWEPFLKPAEIGVTVSEGVVTLSGQVESYTKKFGAERAAWRVRGVRAIVQKIEVILKAEDKCTDSEIAKMVSDNLATNCLVPKDQIHIKVSSGNVYLNGPVRWFYQKQAAENVIRDLKGIKEIFNLISVKNAEKEVIEEHICKALKRSSNTRSPFIRAEVEKNLVVLSGHAKSFAERQCAEIAAWSSPGVSKVENRISVGD